MDLGLKDHVIAVTGGASGIGAAVTKRCVAEGARVLVLSRISPGVEDFIEQTRNAEQSVDLLTMELEEPETCHSAIKYIQQHYGRLDGLVNNAGVNDGVGLEHGDPDKFQASLRRNLLPAYSLTHYALPLLKNSRGSIVNISSKVAITGQGNTSGYAAAKGGLLALTREWAAELLSSGIRVNAVLPAEVMTPAYETWLSSLAHAEVALEQITSQIPLGHRMTTPEEIASTVVFLLSPTHSAHTTGQQIVVDGGYVHLDRMLTARRPKES